MLALPKILIVEDDAIIQLTLRKYVQKIGFEDPLVTDNGHDAIQLFVSHDVGMVLMDIHLYGTMDGVQTSEALKQIRSVPIIYVTASTDPQTLERARRTSPYEILSKPYDFGAVQMALRQVLDEDFNPSPFAQPTKEDEWYSITQNGQKPICVYDQSGKMVVYNSLYCELVGADEARINDSIYLDFIPDFAKDQAVITWKQLNTDPKHYAGEWPIIRANSEIRGVYVEVQPIWRGQQIFWRVQMDDITDRNRYVTLLTQTLQQKEIIYQELHHRVKNNMQFMLGLLFLHAERTGKGTSEQRHLLQATQRLKSLAYLHEHIYQSPNFIPKDPGGVLNQLATQLLEQHEYMPFVELDSQWKGVELDANQLVACGLILHEFFSHTLSHAFPDDRPNRKIAVRLEPGDRPHTMSFSLSHNGRSFHETREWQEGTTLSGELIRSLARQLDARCWITEAEGLSMVLQFGHRAGAWSIVATHLPHMSL